MTPTNTTYMEKILNPNLALAALNCLEPQGQFLALIKMADGSALPDCLTDVEHYAPGLVKAHIPCARIEDAAADQNVISIELREHVI